MFLKTDKGYSEVSSLSKNNFSIQTPIREVHYNNNIAQRKLFANANQPNKENFGNHNQPK